MRSYYLFFQVAKTADSMLFKDLATPEKWKRTVTRHCWCHQQPRAGHSRKSNTHSHSRTLDFLL